MNVQPPEKNENRWKAPFFTVWTGQAFSLLGSQLVQFALIWYLTVSTGSATVLALAALAGLLPQIVISPFAGALVDRWPRRRVMITADAGIALATLLFAVLFALHLNATWQIYLLLFARAVGGAFHWPAMQASTTLMVPPDQLARVGGMNQMLLGVAGILIPPAGALLVAWLPMEAILMIDITTALLAIGPLCWIAIPQPAGSPHAARAGQRGVLADLGDGLRFLWNWPGLLLIVLIGTVIRLLVGPGVALMPLLVRDHFGGGALQLAWLQTSGGVGYVVGGLTLSLWGGFKRRVATAMIALVLDGLAICTVGLAPDNGLLLAVGASFCAGLVEPILIGSLGAAGQAVIPPAMQGRIFALSGAIGAAAAPVGLALAGPLADVLGVQVWFIAGGLAMAVMGISAFFIPAVMQIEARPLGGVEPGSAAA